MFIFYKPKHCVHQRLSVSGRPFRSKAACCSASHSSWVHSVSNYIFIYPAKNRLCLSTLMGSERFAGNYFLFIRQKKDCVCPPWCNHQRAAPTSCSWTPPWSPGSSGGSRASHIWLNFKIFHPQLRWRSNPNHTCLRTPRGLTEESCREASPLSSSSHQCWPQGQSRRAATWLCKKECRY